MTLNITVTTPRCIYQSADYRLLDWTTGKLSDFETQKIVLITKFRWAATVCFAGDASLLAAAIYQLAHTAAHPKPILDEVRVRVMRGVRLRWNVLPNIERVKAEQPSKAALLETVRKVMTGEQDQAALEQVLAQWQPDRKE